MDEQELALPDLADEQVPPPVPPKQYRPLLRPPELTGEQQPFIAQPREFIEPTAPPAEKPRPEKPQRFEFSGAETSLEPKVESGPVNAFGGSSFEDAMKSSADQPILAELAKMKEMLEEILNLVKDGADQPARFA